MLRVGPPGSAGLSAEAFQPQIAGTELGRWAHPHSLPGGAGRRERETREGRETTRRPGEERREEPSEKQEGRDEGDRHWGQSRRRGGEGTDSEGDLRSPEREKERGEWLSRQMHT